MMASRGMGAIRKGVVKKRRDNTDFLEGGKRHARRDNTDFTEYAAGGQVYAEGGEVWNKPRPKGLGAPKPLSSAKKASAKAAAKAAGRPYPNLVDNMRAAK
jgi:hypothetical protein